MACDLSSGNICKHVDGVNCVQDGDCKTGSSCRTDRYGNIRNKVCLPNTSLFNSCNSNQECGSGLCGDSGLMSDINGQLQSVHRFPNTLIDVIQEGDNILMLLGDGNVMREVHSSDRSRRLEMIKNDRKLEKFASLGSNNMMLCGLSRGRLYQLDLETSSRNSWKWKLADWAPSGITHISHSYDGNYLWIQFSVKFLPPTLQVSNNIPIRDAPPSVRGGLISVNIPGLETISSGEQPTQYGHLYRFIGTEEFPALIKRSLLSKGITRTYGRNDVCYLEINQINHQATRYPKGDLITDCHLGLLMPDGRVYKIGTKNSTEIRDIRLIKGIPYLITHRQCVPMGNFDSYSAPAIIPVSGRFGLSTQWVT